MIVLGALRPSNRVRESWTHLGWSKIVRDRKTWSSLHIFVFHLLSYLLCESITLCLYLMLSILYPYTAERRDVLGNTSPEAQEISRGVQNPRPREISRAEGDVFPNASRLEAVYVHSLSISREVLILWCVCHLQLERSPS